MKIPSPLGNLLCGALLALLTAGLLIVTGRDESLSGIEPGDNGDVRHDCDGCSHSFSTFS